MQPTDHCSLFAQLAAAAAWRPPRNNRPLAGKPKAKGASIEVLRYLREQSDFKMAGEIRRTTGRSHSAICWALRFLRQIGAVEAVPDRRRNPRYLLYRARAQQM